MPKETSSGYGPTGPGSAKRRPTTIRSADNVRIVFEDEAVLVVNKPAGLLVVPLDRRSEAPSVYELIGHHLRSHKRRPFVVHRIDRDTSGLVVFTKDERTQQQLRAQFKRREPERIYLAVVYGHPNPPQGTWRDTLVWDTKALIQKETHPHDPRGKEAISEYRVVESFETTALVEVRLRTGKRNQIRLQARLRGHTLVGEQRYVFGPEILRPIAFPRQALHAYRLGFRHPIGGRDLQFEAPLPDDLTALLNTLRRCAEHRSSRSLRPKRRPSSGARAMQPFHVAGHRAATMFPTPHGKKFRWSGIPLSRRGRLAETSEIGDGTEASATPGSGTPFVELARPVTDAPRQSTKPEAPPPQTRSELQRWVRQHLQLAPTAQNELLAAIDAVFERHERLWQESKQEAVQALSAGFADKMARAKNELSAKDATVSSIAQYFEKLVADLTDKTQRDPKTKLMNFSRFTEQLESFLALEQRGKWCAVGLVDITGFKWYNDALGHAVGDRIIERVAQLLREQARSDDIIAQERASGTKISTRGSAATNSAFSSPTSTNTTRPARSPSASARRSSGTTGRRRITGSPCSRCGSTSASSACGSGVSPSGDSSPDGSQPR